jgi:GxxExxY protein
MKFLTSLEGLFLKCITNLDLVLFESVYEPALMYQLRKDGLNVKNQQEVPVFYDGYRLDVGFRLDILVEDLVIIEIKSVEEIKKVHHKQLQTYLKLTSLKLGILVNFNTDDIALSIFRKVNNL